MKKMKYADRIGRNLKRKKQKRVDGNKIGWECK